MEILTRQIGAVYFAASSQADAVTTIIERAVGLNGFGTPVFFANAYTVSLADSDKSYQNMLNTAGLTFADGKPISWISRLHGHDPQVHQVRGPDTFEMVISQGQTHQIRHYLLGSTPEVLEKLESNLRIRYPEAIIVGSDSPPFRRPLPEELEERDSRIRRSGAQIVWIGLGTPGQDFEAARIASTTPVLAIAVGAAFDFSAGSKRSAPTWMRNVGLEWLFRLISEPRRLWRRYLVGNVVFLRSCFITLRPAGLRRDESL